MVANQHAEKDTLEDSPIGALVEDHHKNIALLIPTVTNFSCIAAELLSTHLRLENITIS